MAISNVQAADIDRAAYCMVGFYARILVALAMNSEANKDTKESEWAQKSMTLLIKWSTNEFYRGALGDTLTMAMKLLYDDSSAFKQFCRAGGLAAIIGPIISGILLESGKSSSIGSSGSYGKFGFGPVEIFVGSCAMATSVSSLAVAATRRLAA